MATSPATPVVQEYPAAATASTATPTTATTPTTTTAATATTATCPVVGAAPAVGKQPASKPAGSKPSATAPASAVCAPAVPIAPAAQLYDKVLQLYVGILAALVFGVALYVRVCATNRWSIRALAGLLVLQSLGFVLALFVNSLQAPLNGFDLDLIPTVKAGFAIALQMWCLQVFRETERARAYEGRVFTGPHLIAQIEEAEMAKANALVDGANGSSQETPSWLQAKDDEGETQVATIAEPQPTETPNTVFSVSGPLGTEMLGSWLECAGQMDVHIRLNNGPGPGVEMMLADENGVWHSVPHFDAGAGTAAVTLPAGRWYAAVRDNEGRNLPVTLLATYAQDQAA